MRTDWRAAVQQRRREKDEYFGENPQSPISPSERDSFDGLSYYPPEEDYRFEVSLHRHDDPETVTVGTSTGGERAYLRWGEFHVEIDGEAVTIQAYKADEDDERLWIPFRDATSGEETYGAGRYIDLEADEHRHTGDGGKAVWVLDFNEAYNPTCAYADAYDCPLPPQENWLDVPIEAGEKAYH